MLKTFSSLASRTVVPLARPSIKTCRLAMGTTLCLSVLSVGSASAISLDFTPSGFQGSVVVNRILVASESENTLETGSISTRGILSQSAARSLLLNGIHPDSRDRTASLSLWVKPNEPQQWMPAMDSEMLQLFVASATLLNKLEQTRTHKTLEKQGISGITNYYLYRSSQSDRDEEESKKDKRKKKD